MSNANSNIPNLEEFCAPYFFFSNTHDTNFAYVSPSVEEVLGYKPEHLVGRSFTRILDKTSPLNNDIAEFNNQRFCENDDRTVVRLRVVETNDKTLKVLKVQSYGQFDERGEIVLNLGMAQDVTNLYFVETEMHNRLSDLTLIINSLTDREKVVLDHITEGGLNKVIAKRLDISERSVEKARSSLVDKFKVESIVEVVAKSTEFKMLNDVILLAQDRHSKPFDVKMKKSCWRSNPI